MIPYDDANRAKEYVESLVYILKGLSNPLRLKILALCSVREMSNRELRETLGISKPLLLVHLKELAKRGLIEHRVVVDEGGLRIKKYYRTSSFTLCIGKESLRRLGEALLEEMQRNSSSDN